MKPLLFALPGNEAMAAALCRQGGFEAGRLELRAFPDGESHLRLLSEPAGREVVLHPRAPLLGSREDVGDHGERAALTQVEDQRDGPAARRGARVGSRHAEPSASPRAAPAPRAASSATAPPHP